MKKKNQWVIRNIETNKVSSFKVGADVSHPEGQAYGAGKSYSHFTNFIKNGLTVLISVFVIYGVVQAGTITPPSGSGEPTAKFYTLSEIYEFIANNTAATEGGHDFTFSDSLAGTSRTLTEIYSALANLISADQVKLGTTYLGVDGTLIPSGGDAGTGNVCNGNTFFGSGQADWNLQTGALAISPSAVISGNTYCGVAGTAVATPTYGDNDASKVLTIAGNAGTYNAANLSAENVRNAIAFGVGQTGTFTGNLAYGDDNAANVLTIAATPGTYNVSNLSNSVIKSGTTWGVSLGSTGTLTPDGGTAAAADLFNGKTAHLTADWNLDSGTLNLACNTATFNGAGNIVTDAYDGDGNGTNRWCMTDSGDAATSDILSGKIAWVDGVARTGTYDASNLFVGTVKSGTTFDVSSVGEYPSDLYLLPSAGATADLAASAGNITSSNGAVEWWQPNGTRQTATLDFPTLSNVCSTDTSNNSTGTLTVTASTIGVGNTVCGTAGTLLANLYNGSAGANVADSAFYTQAKGGVDDYNNNGTMPGDSYTGTWTTCDAGNNYCETGDSTNADKKDDSTGLVWSKWLDSGTTHTWFWANNCYEPGTAENPVACAANGDDGCQCVKKTSAQVGCEALGGGWRLPYQKELMQAYIDGSWGNLSSAGTNYWSATTTSNYTHYAWYTPLTNGTTRHYNKTNLIRARCVR